jgi:uncharacterized protein (DUF433 family)
MGASMQDNDVVVRDPAIMGGVPVLRGTRIPVSLIFENLADGMTIDQILAEWPSLTRPLVEQLLQETARSFDRPAA